MMDPERSNEIFHELLQGKIIPDITNSFCPSVDIQISFGKKMLRNGMRVPPRLTQLGRPRVVFPKQVPGMYTLVLTHADEYLDSSDKPQVQEKCLWIVVNIPGVTDPSQDVWHTGIEATPFLGVYPEQPGVHRYCFFLFKQPHDKPAPSTFPVNCRYRFTTKDFAKAHDLREPVAGLYFTSEKEKDVCKPCRYRRGITLELGLNTV